MAGDSGRGRPGVELGGPKPWARSAEASSDSEAAKDREWIERDMRWCLAEFGPEAVKREIALPTADFFPPGFTGTDLPLVGQLVRRVAEVMGVDIATVSVRMFESAPMKSGRSRAVGHYHRSGDWDVIELDVREAEQPEVFAAVIAHELGHVRILGEQRLEPGDDDPHEKLTDLVTVFLGMGVFTANAAIRYARSQRGFSILPAGDLTSRVLNGATAGGTTHHLGYLTADQFGHALACYAQLRGESDPAWARHLEPGVRAALKRGLARRIPIAPD